MSKERSATKAPGPELAIDDAASSMETLGNVTRLKIFRELVRAGPAGLAVGEIQARLGIPGSTLSHHIAQLVHNGLIEQRREGRILRCAARYERIARLIAFLTDKCCADADTVSSPR